MAWFVAFVFIAAITFPPLLILIPAIAIYNMIKTWREWEEFAEMHSWEGKKILYNYEEWLVVKHDFYKARIDIKRGEEIIKNLPIGIVDYIHENQND